MFYTSNISVILIISLKEAPLVHSWTISIIKGLNLSTYSSSSSSIFASLDTLDTKYILSLTPCTDIKYILSLTPWTS